MAKKTAAFSRTLAYKRILLKLSGEVFSGSKEYGISAEVMKSIAGEIKQLYDLGTEIGIVIGGGNIFRGNSESARGMDRVSADYMGMLATVMNAWRCRIIWKNAMCRPGCSQQSRCGRLQSRSSGAGQRGIWKRSGW